MARETFYCPNALERSVRDTNDAREEQGWGRGKICTAQIASREKIDWLKCVTGHLILIGLTSSRKEKEKEKERKFRLTDQIR